MNVSTPHINASPKDFAETVLMPGDPKRARFIAENFLSLPILVNDLRGVQGYTGLYKGQRVSVMASGMGIPSIAIYSNELFKLFGVEQIIRLGTAGGIAERLSVGNLVIADKAVTDSNYPTLMKYEKLPATADRTLFERAVKNALERRLTFNTGTILSSDLFYGPEGSNMDAWKEKGVLAVEMEAAALYINAALAKRKALAICTCSNHLYKNEEMSAEERERSLLPMIELGLSLI